MINVEDCLLAYRLFFDREPENLEIVKNLSQRVGSLSELRHLFLNSEEFKKIYHIKNNINLSHARHPFHLPHIQIESQTTEDLLIKLFKHTNESWTYLGNEEPYWSTITQEEFLSKNFQANSHKFFESGKPIVDIFLAYLRRNNINPNFIDSILEVGCSVGRVTLHLAKTFSQVFASDISEPHLMLCEQRAKNENIKNIQFLHWKDIESISNLPKVDAVFSVITLQHNPPPVIAFILRKLLNTLNPGGIGYIQFTTYRSGYYFDVARYLQSAKINELEMHCLSQQDIFKIIDASECFAVEVREDRMAGDEENMMSNTFLIRKKQK